MELNLFKADLKIEFEACDLNDNLFLQEYLSINTNRQLAKWKKLAYRVDFEDSEKIIFDLLLSLKEDISRIENHLFKKNKLLALSQLDTINLLNFEYINFKNENLIENQEYYARFEINDQKIAFYFKALNRKLAKIIKIKSEDQDVYNAFVVEIQRDIIKTFKGK